MKKILFILLLLPVFTEAQIITTFAGNGVYGYGGDGGAATAAQLKTPFDVTIDALGNVYFTDYGSANIRKIDLSGLISTIAGNSIAGYSGDGGPATNAQLNGPYNIVADGTGNVYFSDNGNSRVRKVTPFGIISTIAGTGIPGYSGDGIPATMAQLNYPTGIAVDVSGNVYISDNQNHRVRKVDLTGMISTIAGNGSIGYTGDGGPATTGEIAYPDGLAVDGSGYIYIADHFNQCIRIVSPARIISTIAGIGTGGFSGDGGPATLAQLNAPVGVAVDGSGNMYIADHNNNRVRYVNASGTISTMAGNGIAGYSGDGGPATAGELNFPQGIATDGNGHVYVADEANSRVRMITCPVATITTPGDLYSLCAGATITLSDTTSGGTWGSGSASVATIGGSGIVMGVSAGTATISYSVSNSCGVSNTTTTVTVDTFPNAGTISGIDSVCPGNSVSLSDIATGGVWNAVNSKASLSGSVVSGVASGTDTILYTVTNSCGTAVAKFPFIVRSKSVCRNEVISPPNGSGHAESVIVFPNPATISLTITSTDKINSVAITNLIGQTVYNNYYHNEEVQVDVSNLPAGMYLIRINGTEVRKFVKE